MPKKQTFEFVYIGFAIFAMFFGAGNVIFPLAVGKIAGEQNFWAITGLLCTAVIIPFTGVVCLILYDGNYREFFNRIGVWPGFIIALTIITLLGPIGSLPRCITLAYSSFKTSFPSLSITFFSLISCFIIFFASIKKSKLIDLLGKFLTPFLLIFLIIIVFIGLISPASSVAYSDLSKLQLFTLGLKEGYNTMDLMAAFFFCSTIISILKTKILSSCNPQKSYFRLSLKAALVGAVLLSAVYVGFSFLAAKHGADFDSKGPEELLSLLTIKVLGPFAGYLVAATVGLACLTTAIALNTVFCEFIYKDLFKLKLSFKKCLILSLSITFLMSTLEFKGISSFLAPILSILYPGLIILTFYNLAYKLLKKSANISRE